MATDKAVGDACGLDSECSFGSSCDNDTVGGAATCKCVAEPTCVATHTVGFWAPAMTGACASSSFVSEFGGVGGEWSMRLTCRRTDGACSETTEDVALGRGATDVTQLCWSWHDDAERLRGQLCGSDFAFTSPDDAPGEYRTGVFHFSSDREYETDLTTYDTKDGNIVERCKGRGRDTQFGSPSEPPTCDEYQPFGPVAQPYSVDIVARSTSGADVTSVLPNYDTIFVAADVRGRPADRMAYAWRTGADADSMVVRFDPSTDSELCGGRPAQACIRLQPFGEGELGIFLETQNMDAPEEYQTTSVKLDIGPTLFSTNLPVGVSPGSATSFVGTRTWQGFDVVDWSWEASIATDDSSPGTVWSTHASDIWTLQLPPAPLGSRFVLRLQVTDKNGAKASAEHRFVY